MSVQPQIITNAGTPQGTVQALADISRQLDALKAAGTNLAPASVSGDRLVANTITAAEIAAGTITATQIAATTITAGQIAAGTITSGQIATGAILAINIATGTITATQIASGTLTATQIQVGSITGDRIAANSITSSQIAAGTITATQIAAGTITGSQIAANTITVGNVGFNIGGANLQANSSFANGLTNWHQGGSPTTTALVSTPVFPGSSSGQVVEMVSSGGLVDLFYNTGTAAIPILPNTKYSGTAWVWSATTSVQIQCEIYWYDATGTFISFSAAAQTPSVVGAWKPSTVTVTSPSNAAYGRIGVYAMATVSGDTHYIGGYLLQQGDMVTGYTPDGPQDTTAQFITPGTITSTQIAATTITGSNIATGTITASNILSGTITTTQIAATTITANNIAASTITGSKIAATTIAAGNIVSGTITSTQIATATITATNIAANTITGSLIASSTITGSNLVAGTITATQIGVSSLSAISANLGTITAGTITGATFQTSASNPRVYMDSTGIGSVDSSGVTNFKVDATTGKITTLAGIGGGNYLLNSGFEQPSFVSQWGVGPAPVFDATFKHSGNQSLKLTSDGTTAVSVNIEAKPVACQPNEPWTASGWIYHNAAAAITVTVYVRFRNSTGVQTDHTTAVTVQPNTWTRMVGSGTSASDSVSVSTYIPWMATPPAAGVNIWVDDCQLERGLIATSYAPKPDEILASTVTGGSTGMIASNTVTGSNLVAGTITATQIQSATITSTQIAANTITAGNIVAGTITSAQIAAGTITGANIAAGTITASNLSIVPGGANLQPNSSFAAGAGVYGGANFSSATLVATPTFPGSSSGKVFSMTANGAGIMSLTGAITGVPVKPNTSYVATTWVQSAAVSRSFYTIITWYNSSSTVVSTTTGTAIPSVVGAWTAATVTGTAPSTAAYGLVQCYITGPASGEVHYIGAFQIQEGTVGTSYTPDGPQDTSGTFITPGTITTTQIASGAGITGSQIATTTISGGNIITGTITSSQIATGTITANNIATATITAGKIAGGTITAAQIASGTITGTQIAAASITATQISVSSLSSLTANMGTLTSGTIVGATIETATSAPNVVINSSGIVLNASVSSWITLTPSTGITLPASGISSSTFSDVTWNDLAGATGIVSYIVSGIGGSPVANGADRWIQLNAMAPGFSGGTPSLNFTSLTVVKSAVSDTANYVRAVASNAANTNALGYNIVYGDGSSDFARFATDPSGTVGTTAQIPYWRLWTSAFSAHVPVGWSNAVVFDSGFRNNWAYTYVVSAENTNPNSIPNHMARVGGNGIFYVDLNSTVVQFVTIFAFAIGY